MMPLSRIVLPTRSTWPLVILVLALIGLRIASSAPARGRCSYDAVTAAGPLRFIIGEANTGTLPNVTRNGDDFAVHGDLTLNGQDRVILDRGTLTFTGQVIHDGKEIRTHDRARTLFLAGLRGAGPFTGAGTVHIEARLQPGNSPACIDFGGDLVIGAAATVEIEIGGPTPCTEHDQINVAGTLSVYGTLDVVLINGFVPKPGDTFDIFTCSSRVGEFSNVQLPTLPAGRVADVQYSDTSIVVAIVQDCNENGIPDIDEIDSDGDGIIDDCDLCPGTVPGAPVDDDGCPPLIPGDYDRDGDVDRDDLDEFESCASGPEVLYAGDCADRDFDEDSDVDQGDFAVFQRCISGEGNLGDPDCAD